MNLIRTRKLLDNLVKEVMKILKYQRVTGKIVVEINVKDSGMTDIFLYPPKEKIQEE